jgi:hypothetical protein
LIAQKAGKKGMRFFAKGQEKAIFSYKQKNEIIRLLNFYQNVIAKLPAS